MLYGRLNIDRLKIKRLCKSKLLRWKLVRGLPQRVSQDEFDDAYAMGREAAQSEAAMPAEIRRHGVLTKQWCKGRRHQQRARGVAETHLALDAEEVESLWRECEICRQRSMSGRLMLA